MKLINKVVDTVIKMGASASSAASVFNTHEPKRPSKLK